MVTVVMHARARLKTSSNLVPLSKLRIAAARSTQARFAPHLHMPIAPVILSLLLVSIGQFRTTQIPAGPFCFPHASQGAAALEATFAGCCSNVPIELPPQLSDRRFQSGVTVGLAPSSPLPAPHAHVRSCPSLPHADVSQWQPTQWHHGDHTADGGWKQTRGDCDQAAKRILRR